MEKYSVTITQTLTVTKEIVADNENEAIIIGNEMVASNTIPLTSYKMMDATVETCIVDNVIPLRRCE